MADVPNLFVEMHALTSHVPSNLNRDELGTPKTAVFGGTRRLRISSQCLKRTWRTSPFFVGELAEEELGIRTRLLPSKLKEELSGGGLPQAAVDGLLAVFATIGKKSSAKESAENEDEAEEDGAEAADGGTGAAEATAHLLYVSRQEINAIKAFALEAKESLSTLVGKGKKGAKADGKKVDALREKLREHLKAHCRRNAVDIALFGRFVTGDEFQTDAALQVAHALGTQKVEVEYDYFSAVDDLSEESGAGHIGESEFAAAVFYKYAVCDLRQLFDNLDGERALAGRGTRALVRALARAVPIGKKNGTAPQNPADYVEVVVRKDAPVSLANAFLRPVTPERDADVMDVSIKRLRDCARAYAAAYSERGDIIARLALSTRKLETEPEVEALITLKDLGDRIQSLVAEAALA